MKKNLSKFVLVALLSMVGVSNAFADWQTVTFVNGDSTNLLNPEQDPSKLCDNNKETKWVFKVSSQWVIFSTENPIVLKRYLLRNGNDNQSYPDRSWKSWKLYGATSADGAWTLLDCIENNPKVTVNYKEEAFEIPMNSSVFQYYKLEIVSSYGENAQMADVLVDTVWDKNYYGRPTVVAYQAPGYSGQEIDKLIDAAGTGTKWCAQDYIGKNFLIMQTSKPIILTSQTFWSGNDTQTIPGRRLTGWDMYGSKDMESWNLLFRSTTEVTSTKNIDSTVHPIPEVDSTYYRYFKFVATGNAEGNLIQMSDLKLKGIIANPHVIAYYANGGSGEMPNQLIYGVDTLLENLFTAPADYVYVGWNTKEDGSGVSYLNMGKIEVNATMPDTIKLYAQYMSTSQIASLLMPIAVSGFTNNCVIGKNEIANPSVTIDGTGEFFSKETDFNAWSGTTSEYYTAQYGMQTKDTINEGNGLRIPFNYSWTGTETFDGNDGIILTNGAKTLTFNDPMALEKLYFCGTAGRVANSTTSINVTITYVDNTTTKSRFYIRDWFVETLPANARHGYARYVNNNTSLRYDGFDEATQKNLKGPNLYCFSLTDVLNTTKDVKSLTFADAGSGMDIAIFAVTGLQCGLVPKYPVNRSAYGTNQGTILTFNEVTENIMNQTISGVTYDYIISTDSTCSDTLALGYLDFTISGHFVTGTLPQNYFGRYIRVRARNNAGVSPFVPVPMVYVVKDTEDPTPVLDSIYEKTVNLKMERTLVAGTWNTFCAPFSLTAAELATSPLKDVDLYTYKSGTVNGSESNRQLEIELEPATELEAGIPYIVQPRSENVENPIFENVKILWKDTIGQTTEGTYIEYIAFMAPCWIAEYLAKGTKDYLGVMPNGKLGWADATKSTGPMRGFRAVFHVLKNDGKDGAPMRGMTAVFVKGQPTDLESVLNDENTIVKVRLNDQIFILKNGKMFNLNGQRVK